jgi:acetyl-CoA acetyltransferase family protein
MARPVGEALAYIPYGRSWTSPFAKWQGSLSGAHAIELAASTAAERMKAWGLDADALGTGVLGTTIPQRGVFYGLPWLASLAGVGHLAGPTISQACATSARVIETAAREVAGGSSRAVLCVTADRTSNGPHVYYPDPAGPGGTGQTEDWVLANFDRDPATGLAMVDTAENVAVKHGVSREEQDDVTVLRYEQYGSAEAAKLRARVLTPVTVGRGRRAVTVEADEGVTPLDEAKVRGLPPVREGGSVTYAGQTHPADGNAGLIVADEGTAREMSAEPVTVRLLAFGQARVEPAYMPEAPVPAARRAMAAAGVTADDLDVVTSHNPFAVNDVVFSRELGVPLDRMNPSGCSLVYGHPQGPTGMRAVAELIEALAARGGGTGLFQGCAAGDSAMAVVLSVDDAR